MLSWNEIIQKYIIRYSDLVKSTTRTLRDNFGIQYFAYNRIYETGKFIGLTDHLEFLEHYVNDQLFLNDPFKRHPSIYRSGLCFAEDHGSSEFKEQILRAEKQVLQTDKIVILVEKEDGYAEIFGFGGNSGKSSLHSLYLNRPQLLKSFASHFKNQLSPVLTKMENEPISLIDLKGEDFFCKQPIYPDIDSPTLVSYFKDLGIKFEFEKADKLSPRERQCLKLLIEDKTAKEIAVHLGLSRRTIEFYFENIKDKLSCWSKQELLAIARTLEEAALL